MIFLTRKYIIDFSISNLKWKENCTIYSKSWIRRYLITDKFPHEANKEETITKDSKCINIGQKEKGKVIVPAMVFPNQAVPAKPQTKLQ